jgi:hypothetical protein
LEESGLLDTQPPEALLQILYVLDVTVELGEVMRLFGQPQVNLNAVEDCVKLVHDAPFVVVEGWHSHATPIV